MQVALVTYRNADEISGKTKVIQQGQGTLANIQVRPYDRMAYQLLITLGYTPAELRRLQCSERLPKPLRAGR